MSKTTYIRLKVDDYKKFDRFIVSSVEDNIKTIIGISDNGNNVQSILFPKNKYGVAKAHDWALNHGYHVQETYLVEDIGINPKTFDIYFIEEVYMNPKNDKKYVS